MAGRGFGKTRTGGEWVRSLVEQGKAKRIALVAPTAADARDVMIEGESGLLAISPPWFKPRYEPSKRRLTWPNGAIATAYSADEPERLRGPQHDAAWCDELAAWRYPEAWDMLMFGLRLGTDPRCVVTTTPKPVPLVKDLLKQPTTVVIRGSTYDNAGNLAKAFLDQIVEKYEGTRLGRQELNAELLDDNPYALWKRGQIDASRVRTAPDLLRIVVGVDPTATSSGDEAGIVVAGVGMCNCKGTPEKHGFVLADESLQGSPAAWGSAAVNAYHKHKADRILGETNNGGEMIEYTIKTVPNGRTVSYKGIHASRGKRTRAEPVASLYEQGKVHHVGSFAKLEDEMCNWTPDEEDSPNRMDALVWALSELMLKERRAAFAPVIT